MRPAIIGVAGHSLTQEEAALLRRFAPAGVILFSRNIDTPAQLAALSGAVRAILPQALLMVDQEGGRVARLRPPYWRAHPPAVALGSARAAWLTGALIGLDCRAAGFDVVAAPVLDVAVSGAHAVIGDRSFGPDPRQVAKLGRAMAEGLLAAGIQPVGKHVPGHGRARADSHVDLPELDSPTTSDLLPFLANAWLPWFMTAHIRYSLLDMQNPATQSSAIIGGLIRAPSGLGFTGVLISDDLAMEALTGTPGERAHRAIAAGCDIALHCSGKIEDSTDVLSALGEATSACRERLARARALAERHLDPMLDAAALEAERALLL